MKTNETLKALRQSKGITQSEAAEIFGVSVSCYQKYEREKGYATPSLEVLCRLADYYQISTDYLLGRPAPDLAMDDETKQMVIALQSLPPEKKKAVVTLLLTLLPQP